MALEGTTFAGFSVMQRLARGGMADIYVAQDRNNRLFALRILMPEFRSQWRAKQRFSWGCEVLSKLHHHNIVHVHNTGTFNGLRYVVLEYVERGNLKEHILRDNPALQVNRLRLLSGMASGLAHIHAHGFLHLDFKPENILITQTYEPKITDFDLSIPRPDKPKRISILSGTPSYLAPEQIAREPVDERADIFAFGLTAYELLSGKKPVVGNTREEVLQKYIDFNNHLRPLHVFVPDIPRAIEHVVLKCLEKDTSRRYPSMALVVRDLQT
jgi:eukaryotic-like serine/threonine-protein kinase